MSKNLNVSNLLDIYGAMLTCKQRELLDLYYNEDLSLSEISELVGTSRQGVMDIIHRGEGQLMQMDSKLHFLKMKESMDTASIRLKEIAAGIKDKEAAKQISEIIDKLGL